jgi:uncharacterized protein (DUF2062 family)/putative flippase GtrA
MFLKTDLNARKEITRFLIAGAIVNAIDLWVYFLLFQFLSVSIAKGISFTCAGIAGYLLNKYWTFDRRQRSYAEVGRYALINLLALGINVLTNRGVLHAWPGAIWPALITATALTSLLTFILFKWWVFRPGHNITDTREGRTTLKARILDLWRSRSSPHEIALGVAIGVFIGITPFYGFHILSALFAAFIIKRVNKVAIFLGINISLPPTIPFITWAGYSIGRKILASAAYPPLGWDAFRHFSYDVFFNFFYALIVGSLVLGIALGFLFYFLTLWVFKRREVAFPVTGERGVQG